MPPAGSGFGCEAASPSPPPVFCCKRLRDGADEVCSSKRNSPVPPEPILASATSAPCAQQQHHSTSDQACAHSPLPWGSHAAVGGRPYMEDSHSTAQLQQLPCAVSQPLHLFAVFDGHGGSIVSDYLAANAEAYITRALSGRLASSSGRGANHSEDKAISVAMGQALRDAYLALDKDVPTRASNAVGGSTATCVLMDDTRIICANCGDSRAVLSRTDGLFALSEDHKPDRLDEQVRIRKAGGRIINNGCLRVMGMLSMTRAIGDTALQRFGITPEPEVRIINRTSKDEFLIVASDGLWAAMSNQDAVAVTRRCLQRAAGKGVGRAAAACIAAKVLVQAAMKLGSRDNITAIVVDLQVREEAQGESAPPSPTTPLYQPQPLHQQYHQYCAVDAGGFTPASAGCSPPTQQQQQHSMHGCGREEHDASRHAAYCAHLLSAEHLLVQVPAPVPWAPPAVGLQSYQQTQGQRSVPTLVMHFSS